VEIGIGAQLIPAPGQLCVIDAFVAVLLRKLSYLCSACTSATRGGTLVDVFWVVKITKSPMF
jgi:hypothetical protein